MAAPGGVYTSSAPSPAYSGDAPPTREAETQVSSDGEAAYGVPFEVPPGRNGAQPQISLQYSSRNPVRGGIASGWRLPVPMISVDTSQGRAQAVRYQINGRRLISVEEPAHTQPSLIATFRAEGDTSYTRYERHKDGTEGGIWIAYAPDGSKSVFGAGPGKDERAEDATDTTLYAGQNRWFLTSTTDAKGNLVEYSYVKTPGLARNNSIFAEVDVRPNMILYGKNVNDPSSEHHARISFDYDMMGYCPGSNVPIGAQFTYRSGMRIYEGAERLESITSSTRATPTSPWKKARQLVLSYSSTAESCTGRHSAFRQLASVQTKAWGPDDPDATPGVVLPPTTFTYGPMAYEYSSTPNVEGLGEVTRGRGALDNTKPGGWPTTDSILMDLNGDGASEQVDGSLCESLPKMPWANGSTPTGNGPPRYRLGWEGCSLSAQVTHRETPRDQTAGNPADYSCGQPTNFYGYRFFDVNGDGKPDLVAALDYQKGRYRPTEDPAINSAYPACNSSAPRPCRDAGGNAVACTFAEQQRVLPLDTSFAGLTGVAAFASPAEPSETGGTGGTGGGCAAGSCPDPGCLAVVADGATCCGTAFCPAAGSHATATDPPAPDAPEGGGDPPSLASTIYKGNSSGGDPYEVSGALPHPPTPLCGHVPDLHCGYYVYRVYLNESTGSTTSFASTPAIVRSPVPIDSMEMSTDAGDAAIANASAWRAIVDLDGDDRPDAIYQRPLFLRGPADTEPTPFQVWFGSQSGTAAYTGQADGQGFAWKAPAAKNGFRIGVDMSGSKYYTLTTTSPVNARKFRAQLPSSSLNDINGDGLLDLVRRDENGATTSLVVFYNTGRGFEADGTVISTQLTGLTRRVRWTARHAADNSGNQIQLSMMGARLADLDGDGLSDVVAPPEPTDGNVGHLNPLAAIPGGKTYAYYSAGDRLVRVDVSSTLGAFRTALAQVTFDERDSGFRTVGDFTDMNGDGTPDMVMPANSAACDLDTASSYFTYESCGYSVNVHYAPSEPLRLLKTINNGVGATTTFAYAPLRDASVVTRDSNHLRADPKWVVKSVTTTGAGTTAITQHAYVNPVFNFDNLGRFGFRGFERHVVTSPATATGRQARAYVDFRYDLEETGLPRRKLSAEVSATGAERLIGVEETGYVETPVLDDLRVFQVGETINSTCAVAVNGTSEADVNACLADAKVARVTNQWQAYNASGGAKPVPVVYAVGASRRLPTREDSTAGVRFLTRTHTLRYTTSKMHLLVTGETVRDATNTQFARTSRSYDTIGNEIETRVWVDATNFAKTTRTFDAKGNVSTETRPMQQGQPTPLHRSLTYDAWGLYMSSGANELGQATSQSYDLATGAVVEALGIANEAGARAYLRTKIDGLGRPTRRERGTVVGPTYTGRAFFQAAYVDTGATRSVTAQTLLDEAEDKTERWVSTVARFDALGRLSREEMPSAAGTAMITRAYDNAGNLVSVTVPNPAGAGTQTFTLEYDGLGRTIRTQAPLLAAVETTYEGATTTVRQNSTDATPSSVKKVVSDSFGRVETVREGAAQHTTSYAYDIMDRVVAIMDADGVVTDIGYDQRGLRTQITRGLVERGYAYDLHGNRIAETHPTVSGEVGPAKDISVWRYDALDRLYESEPALREWSSKDVEHFSKSGGTHLTRYFYDEAGHGFGAGRLTTVETPVLTTRYDYSSEGWLTKERRSFSLAPDGMVISGIAETELTYGPGGQVTRQALPDGATIAKPSYDERGRPARLDVTTGAVTTLAAKLTRNLAGFVTQRTTGVTGLGQSYDRDGAGRVTRDLVRAKWGCTGASCPITDAAGETLTFNSLGQVTSATDLSKGRVLSYTYDDLNQLVAATTGANQAYAGNFSYTPGGKVLSANVASNLPGADVVDRNVQHNYAPASSSDVADPSAVRSLVDTATGSALASFEYDAAGNLSREASPDGTKTFVYDGDNRLREARDVVTGDCEIYYYGHDGERVLTYRKNGGSEELRHRFGGTEIFHQADGSVAGRTADVALDGPPLARVVDGSASKLEYLFHGVLGSLLLATNEAGEGGARFGYGPFGEELYAEGAKADAYDRRYNGEAHDSFTNHRYYGARYYNPLTLSWTQGDPLYRFLPEIAFTEPRRASLYTFNLNNPVSYVDPDGRDPADWRRLGEALMAREKQWRELDGQAGTAVELVRLASVRHGKKRGAVLHGNEHGPFDLKVPSKGSVEVKTTHVFHFVQRAHVNPTLLSNVSIPIIVQTDVTVEGTFLFKNGKPVEGASKVDQHVSRRAIVQTGPLGLIGESTKGEAWLSTQLGEDLAAMGANLGVVNSAASVTSDSISVRSGIDVSGSVTETSGSVSVTIGPFEGSIGGEEVTRDLQSWTFSDTSTINLKRKK